MSNSKRHSTSSLQRKTFLITCWQERDALVGRVFWRFILETAAECDKRLFTDLQDVIAEIEDDLHRQIKKEDN